MSTLPLGLAESVREWFSGPGASGGGGTAVETAPHVEVATKPKVSRSKKKKVDEAEAPVEETVPTLRRRKQPRRLSRLPRPIAEPQPVAKGPAPTAEPEATAVEGPAAVEPVVPTVHEPVIKKPISRESPPPSASEARRRFARRLPGSAVNRCNGCTAGRQADRPARSRPGPSCRTKRRLSAPGSSNDHPGQPRPRAAGGRSPSRSFRLPQLQNWRIEPAKISGPKASFASKRPKSSTRAARAVRAPGRRRPIPLFTTGRPRAADAA